MISPVKLLLASALTATVVNGHGWMTKPAATFKPEAGDKSQFIATIEASSSGFKGTFNTAPADNVASFTKAFKASTYKSLKAFIDDKAKVTVTGATLTCGNADPDATAQPLPATLEWSHSDSEGFTPSHEGPCEAWCDDAMVFSDENCAANFKTAPAEMPYEKSKCSGASKFTFYWMAMHGPTWQVYVNCAPLSGGSGGGTTQSSGSSATTTDSSSAESPAAQTPSSGGSPSTPSSGGSPSTPTTDSSSADTPSVTPAPVSGGSPSTNTTPAPASGGSPSTSTTPAPASGGSPSTPTTEESDCGSYDVAGGKEDEGQDNNTPTTESDCGSYDVAGGSGDEGKDNGTPTTGGNTYQQSGNTGTETQTNTGGSTNKGGNTGGNTDQWTNNGGNNNQWNNNGNNNNQWTNTGTQNTGTQQNSYQNTGTGSQNSYNFNTFQGNTNAGTVSPQKM